MNRRISGIIKRIENADPTITEADFYAPPDERNIRKGNCGAHKYYKEFNMLSELEGFYDNNYNINKHKYYNIKSSLL